MKFKVKLEYGRSLEFDLEAESEEDAKRIAEDKADQIFSYPGEVYLRNYDIEQIDDDSKVDNEDED